MDCDTGCGNSGISGPGIRSPRNPLHITYREWGVGVLVKLLSSSQSLLPFLKKKIINRFLQCTVVRIKVKS